MRAACQDRTEEIKPLYVVANAQIARCLHRRLVGQIRPCVKRRHTAQMASRMVRCNRQCRT